MNRLYTVLWKFKGEDKWATSYCLVYDKDHHDAFGLNEDEDVALLVDATNIKSVEDLEANFEYYLRENNHEDIELKRFDFITER